MHVLAPFHNERSVRCFAVAVSLIHDMRENETFRSYQILKSSLNSKTFVFLFTLYKNCRTKCNITSCIYEILLDGGTKMMAIYYYLQIKGYLSSNEMVGDMQYFSISEPSQITHTESHWNIEKSSPIFPCQLILPSIRTQ